MMKKPANWADLSDALSRQAEFSSLFFDNSNITLEQKKELLKTFVLSLHSETTGICEAIDYKDHRLQTKPVDTQKILYKSVDAYRYILAMLNLWGINASKFEMALAQKDDFLHYRHRLSSKKWQEGQPVALFDMDDVLAEFRKSFCSYVTQLTGHFIDPESEEYYNVREFKRLNINSENFFKNFIDNHGFLLLEKNEKYLSLLRHLQAEGWWIQIITARPEQDLTSFYDTYSWLARNAIDVDGVTFTPEKFVWVSEQPYYSRGKYFAIDDSAKHAAEYAKHSVVTMVPEKPYNKEVKDTKNVIYVPKGSNPIDFIPVL
jgi:hypothetical protein